MIKEIDVKYEPHCDWGAKKSEVTNQVKKEGFVSGVKLGRKYNPQKLMKLAKEGKIDAYYINFDGSYKWYYKMDDILKIDQKSISR